MEKLESSAFKDFRGRDLRDFDLSCSKYIHCNFDDCNLEKVNCTHSIFNGSTFHRTNCRYTDFGHSALQDTAFFPSDAYGATFTMECRTFQNMKVSKQWWYCFMHFGMLMVPELDKGKDPRDLAINLFGSERYLRLSRMFRRRGL